MPQLVTKTNVKVRNKSSFPLSNLRQQARVVIRLCAQVLGFGNVEEDVHNVGGHVEGKSDLVASVALRTVAVQFTPELRLAQVSVFGRGYSPPLARLLRGKRVR